MPAAIRRNAIKRALPAKIEFISGDGRRGLKIVIELVGGRDFQLRAILEHQRRAVSPGDVDMAAGADERWIDHVNSAKALLAEDRLACFGVEAGEHGLRVCRK